MAFNETEFADHVQVIEELFWSRRRPPLHLRGQLREGQRISGQSIELFFVRPAFQRPGEFLEEPIAKLQWVRSRKIWRLFWKRADGQWHGYKPHPEAQSLAAALEVIHDDAHGCFFG